MRNPTAGMLRSIFASTALLAVTAVHAQTANVVAATSVTNQIEQVTPTPPPNGSTTVLNTDESQRLRYESLAFNNSGPSLNLLAGDNLNHNVVQYTGDFSCSPLTACSTGSVLTQINNIRSPQGLSLDRAGDLYLVNDTPGTSPASAVYVALTDGSGGFQSAQLIDNTSFGKMQSLVETLIVGTPPSNGDINANLKNGDLLVLANGPNALFRYAATGGISPTGLTTPTTLLAQCAHKQTITCIPAGEVPQGIAIWEDGTLLMSTQSGRILNYDCSGASPPVCTQLTPDFADISAGLFKIKVARELGQMSAFVAQSGPGNHGSVIELTRVSGTIQVVANVNTGGNTQGIAVTNAAQVLASTCQQQNGQQLAGCDPLGGNGPPVLRHIDKIDPNSNNPNAGNLTGSVVDDLCVARDTRKTGNLPPLAACGDHSLRIKDICGSGFDNTGQTLQIPTYMCAGPSGNLAIVRVKDNHQNYDQTLVENAENWDSVLPGGNNPVCGPVQGSQQIALGGYGWTLGESPLVGVGGVEDFNGGCDGPTPRGGNISLFVIGAALDCYASVLNSGPFTNTPAAAGPPACLWNFEYLKYNNMLTNVANLLSGNGGSVPPAITPQEAQLLTNGNPIPTNPASPPPPGTPGCIDNSLSDFITAAQLSAFSGLDPNGPTAYFQAAANLLTNADAANNTTCDSIVTNNLGAFTEQLGGGAPNYNPPPILNPSGQVRARLANAEYTDATLILSSPSPASWPPPLTINASCPPGQSCPTTEQGGSATTVNALNGSVNATNGPLNLTWAVDGHVATGCTLTSNDGVYTGTPISGLTQPLPIRPPLADGIYHQYTITCSVPNGTTVPSGTTISATAWAVNFPPPL